MSEWSRNTHPGADLIGARDTIHNMPSPYARNARDAQLIQQRTPQAQYPDGYLGTAPKRYPDDDLNTQTRGPRGGVKMPDTAYFWPENFDLMGIHLESQGRKFAPTMEKERRLTNEGKAAPTAQAAKNSRSGQGMYPKHPTPPWR